MSIVARMQLAMAVVEQFGFESVGQIHVEGKYVEILLHENAEFFKAASDFEETPVDHENIEARLTAKVNGVKLVTYKWKLVTAS